jgi:hypothetical protein
MLHGTIYWERGFITAEGKELRNLPEIQRLLIVVQKPQAVAVVHVPGHQSSQTPEAMGNRQADEVARNAALASTTPEDRQWIQGHRCPESNQQGWYHDDEGQLILPEKLGLFLLSNLHRANHLGKKKLLSLLESVRLRFPHSPESKDCGPMCRVPGYETQQKGNPTYRLTASGLESIIPTCVKPVSKNRKRLESGSHGDTPIIC